jgi:hypothetical protein
MKVILGIFAAFAVSQSFAAEVITPNMYECEGKDASVHYTTSSIVGKPTFGATVRGTEAKLPAFPELKVEQTLIGSLVTARDMHLVMVDGPEVRYTLVLPYVTLDKPFGQAKFDTVLVKSSVANRFFGPASRVGINSEYIPVECVASQVQF